MKRKYTVSAILILIIALMCGCAQQKKGQTNIPNDLIVDDYPDVSMSLTEITPVSASCILKNNSDTDLLYGEGYIIQECRDGEWYYRESASTDEYGHVITIPSIGHDLESGSVSTIEHFWKVIYGELPSGKYRIIKDFFEHRANTFHEYYVSCEFEIKE